MLILPKVVIHSTDEYWQFYRLQGCYSRVLIRDQIANILIGAWIDSFALHFSISLATQLLSWHVYIPTRLKENSLWMTVLLNIKGVMNFSVQSL